MVGSTWMAIGMGSRRCSSAVLLEVEALHVAAEKTCGVLLLKP